MSAHRTNQSASVLSRSHRRSQVLALAALSGLVGGAVHAADVVKLDNALSLNDPNAWSGLIAPTAIDVAVYDGTITSGPITNALGADTTWAGIRIGSPAGLVTISAGNILTLGNSGIDMSGASQDLSIAATVATLVGSKQTWNVASGRTLTITPALTRGARSTVNFNGDGNIVLTGGTATSLLPWGMYKGTDMAALDATKTVKGATTVFAYTNPAGGTVANNTSSTPYGINVNQPTTLGATQAYRHGNSVFTSWGVRFNEDNTQAGTWTVDTSTSGRVCSTPVILVTSNVTQDIIYGGSGGVRAFNSGGELVLNHNGSGNLIFNTTINGNGTSGLLKLGSGKLIVASASGYTGQTSVMEGVLQLGNGGAAGSLGSGTILLNNTTLAFNRSDATGAYAGVISGTGALEVNNTATGAYALTGVANTYTGPTNVNSGGLIINNIGNIPATSTINLNGGSIVHAATTAVDISARTVAFVGNGTINTNGNDVVYANPIGNGGSGALTKVGAGVLTFTGVNTYTGGTTVNAGTLRVSNTSGAHPGNVTVNSSATLGGVGTISGTTTIGSGATLAPGASVGTLHTGSLDLQGSSLASWEFVADGSNYDKAVVTQSGGLTLNGGAFTLLNEGTVNPFSVVGNYNLIQYTGAVNGAGTSALSIANPQPGKNYAFSLNGGFVKLSISTAGVVAQWITDGGGSWSNSANWSPATVPNAQGATANFTTNLTNPSTVTLDGDKTIGATVFQSANGYTIAQGTGGSLKIDNGGSLATVSVLQGNHTISAPVSLLSSTQVSTVVNSSIAMTGAVSGSTGISKNGPGTLLLTGSNSFSGGIQLNDGTLGVGDSNALGSGITNMNTTGSLRFDANNLVIPNTITINTGATGVIDTQTNTITLTNEMNGSGIFNKAGNGTLISLNNLYAGTSIVSAGTLQVGNGGTLGNLGGDLTNNGALVINRSDDMNFGNHIGGTGLFVKAGTNKLSFVVPMTYTGDTRVAGGTLELFDSTSIQNSTLDYNNYGGVLSFGANATAVMGGLKGSQNLPLVNTSAAGVGLTLGGNNQSTTYSGVLSGTGATLTKVGTGTTTLTGANTYDGNTIVNTGILEVGTGGAIASPIVSISQSGGSARMIVSGGQVTTTGILEMLCNNGNFTSFEVTSGTVNINGGVNANATGPTRSQNTTLRVDGGLVNIASFSSGRAGGTIEQATEPTAGSTTYGVYVTGGALNVAGSLGIGNVNGANSNYSMRVDGGNVTVGGPITVSLNHANRWSVVDIAGGTFTSTDTTQGILLGGAGTHTVGNNILLVRGGVATVERVQFGTGSYSSNTTYATNGVVSVSGGTLYMGSGGIVLGTTGAYKTMIRLASGTLGAKADWSSDQPVSFDNTTGAGYIKAADATGAPFNISLSGVAAGAGGVNKVGAGTLTLSGANTYAGNTTVTGGTVVLGTAAHAPVLTGAGAVLNGGVLVMDHTGNATDPKGVIVPDLTTNAATGFQAGKARTSLAADATKAIGWHDDGNIFTARYTYKGDINLSGVVDSTDFNAFVAGYGIGSTASPTAIWANGDADYDGKVNTVDFNYLAGNFGLAAIAAPLPAPSLGSVVPEPSTLGLIGIGSMAMIARRRRAAR